MRSSCERVLASLLILLMLATVQGLQLERQMYRSSHRKLHQNAEVKESLMRRGSGAALALCKGSRQCSSSDQRIPRIHEDYYEPGDHKSKHH